MAFISTSNFCLFTLNTSSFLTSTQFINILVSLCETSILFYWLFTGTGRCFLQLRCNRLFIMFRFVILAVIWAVTRKILHFSWRAQEDLLIILLFPLEFINLTLVFILEKHTCLFVDLVILLFFVFHLKLLKILGLIWNFTNFVITLLDSV